jgi:predicted Rossmann fold flavoprotein
MKIAIVGAGASGLVSAILLAQNNHEVSLYEANSKVGKKLLATGNGKCNISNTNINIDNFHGQEYRLIANLLKQYPTQSVIRFFSSIGLEMIEADNGKLFPLSLQASSVVNLLEKKAKNLGVKICLNTKIVQIIKKTEFYLQTKDNRYTADKVVISTGSKAYTKLGSSSLGYEIASSFGHTIIPTYPSLTALVSNDNYLKKLDGVKINATLNLKHNAQDIALVSGDIMFRDYGLSGLATLDISRHISLFKEHKKYQLYIDLIPSINRDRLISMLTIRKQNISYMDILEFLEGIIHNKLASVIIQKSGLKDKTTIKELNKKDINKIVYTIKNFMLEIEGVRGFDFCEVSTGGVKLSEIDLSCMESKIVKNLYFTGEVLDIDADRGGYNLYFAWISAFAVGNYIKS